jgi:replication initiation and membrane attachment protein
VGQHWQELVPIDRYIVRANGLLYDYDRKVLTFLYQPLIGPVCLSLYMTLWAELEENRLWSESSSHHILMNLLGLNLNDIYESRLKLEGIGLLKTYVNEEDEIRSFIYELQPPLTPEQFFLDGMLNIYLYRKIGKNHFFRLKRFFSDLKIPTDKEYHDVTRAFQDVYSSATPKTLQYLQDVSNDLTPDDDKNFIGRKEQEEIQIDASQFNFDLLMAGLNESLIPQKAINQKVKDAVSNLAFLYSIDAIQMKKFLMDAFNPANDEIEIEELRKAARDWYQFVNYDELPSLIERTQPLKYQVQLQEPKTPKEKMIRYYETTSPLKVLMDRSNGAEPAASDLKVIESLMINQHLPAGVVNVLIDFVLLQTDMKFTKNYVEKIGSQWARKNVKTVIDAMDLAIKENESKASSNVGNTKRTKSYKQKPIRTEILPDWFEEEQQKRTEGPQKEKEADMEAKKREIEEILKEFKK